MKVGFFGLGNMGLPMAINLLKGGFEVYGFDLNDEALKTLEKNGGIVNKTREEVLPNCEAIVTMLPNGSIVKNVYINEGSVFNLVKAGTLLIDCSTISAEDAKSVSSIAAEKKLRMIDAPVSGGVAGATAGTLTFICGGESEHVDAARTILEKMGRNIYHAGESGAGQVAKICNNMLLAIHMIGTAEALNLGMKHGLDPKVLSEIMKVSSGDNWSLQKYNPVPGVMENTPSSNNYVGGFGSVLMTKDLNLGQEAAEKTNSATPLGKLATELFREHSEKAGKGKDFSSIFELIKNS